MSLRISHTSLILVLCWLAGCSHEQEPSETGGQTTGTAGTTAGSAGAGTGVAGAGAAGSAGSKGATTAGSGGATQTQTGTGGQVATAGSSAAGSGGTTVAQTGSGGSAAGSGAGGQAGSSMSAECAPWPKSAGDMPVAATIKVSGNYDGKLQRFIGTGSLGGSGQDEGQDPIFLLANGSTLENVILGAPAADGIHCDGSCTLKNVWWEDVGEDAATLLGSADSQVMSIECGGARKASDKVFQHNGPGTMRIQNFYAEDFGKLYRSCGNCKTQHERHVEMSGIDAIKGKSSLAGINANYNDTAKFDHITVHDTSMKLDICDRYTGNSTGAEPSKIGSGADAKSCVYQDSDVMWVP